MRRFLELLVICSLVVNLGCQAPNQAPISSSGLFVPDDLEATLWAESPLLFNPTNIDVDSRGRLWVTEAVNYRNFNNDSTRFFHHAQGDRVVILEDRDQDGQADTSMVFVQDPDLLAPLGIAVIGPKVYVSCAPHLIVYTDENGDDQPDHKEILLTGFGGLDHDHSLHAVVGGPDGRLYFNTGNAGPHTVTDRSGWTLRSGSIYTGGTPYNLQNSGQRRSDDGRVWVGGLALSVLPSGDQLKVHGHNFRNAYELAVDSYGDLWQNDNDDQVVACRTSWLMEGGNAGFFSSDGTRYWQADQRPWQDVFTAHWHQDDPGVMPAGDNTGAGSPTGIMRYEGDALGSNYNGMILSAEAGRNVIFAYQPRVSGSGYTLGPRKNLVTSLALDNPGYVWNDSAQNATKDKWFRPSDVCTGTDGSIYISDWYDPVVGGHQMQDTLGYGRIYRVSPKGKRLANPKIDLTTSKGLLEAIQNPAIHVRHYAMTLLRKDSGVTIEELKPLLTAQNPYVQARALWLLADRGQSGLSVVKEVLTNHPDVRIRAAALRALRSSGTTTRSELKQYLSRDTSLFVKREWLQSLSGQPFNEIWPTIQELLPGENFDRWYLIALGQLLSSHADSLYKPLKAHYLTSKTQPEQPEYWPAVFADLIWTLHPPDAAEDLYTRLNSDKLDPIQKEKALTTLAFINTNKAAEYMVKLCASSDPLITNQAKYWLAFRQSNDWAKILDWKKIPLNPQLERHLAAMLVKKNRILDPLQSYNEMKWNAQDLAKDTLGAGMLIALAAEHRLPDTLYPAVSRLIFNNPSASIRLQASKYFSLAHELPPLNLAAIQSLAGNFQRGKEKFMQACNACHRWEGKGLDIGPDLSHIGQKLDRSALLDAIVFPDAAIVFGYEPWLIQLKSGGSFLGFILAEGQEYLTIKDVAGVHQRVHTEDIASRKPLTTSLMPQATALKLSPQDLADLCTFLSEANN